VTVILSCWPDSSVAAPLRVGVMVLVLIDLTCRPPVATLRVPVVDADSLLPRLIWASTE
jgi:hypothetical protein